MFGTHFGGPNVHAHETLPVNCCCRATGVFTLQNATFEGSSRELTGAEGLVRANGTSELIATTKRKGMPMQKRQAPASPDDRRRQSKRQSPTANVDNSTVALQIARCFDSCSVGEAMLQFARETLAGSGFKSSIKKAGHLGQKSDQRNHQPSRSDAIGQRSDDGCMPLRPKLLRPSATQAKCYVGQLSLWPIFSVSGVFFFGRTDFRASQIFVDLRGRGPRTPSLDLSAAPSLLPGLTPPHPLPRTALSAGQPKISLFSFNLPPRMLLFFPTLQGPTLWGFRAPLFEPHFSWFGAPETPSGDLPPPRETTSLPFGDTTPTPHAPE